MQLMQLMTCSRRKLPSHRNSTSCSAPGAIRPIHIGASASGGCGMTVGCGAAAGDLKPSLSRQLNLILQPVRDHFATDQNAKDLLKKVKVRHATAATLPLWVLALEFADHFLVRSAIVGGVFPHLCAKYVVGHRHHTKQCARDSAGALRVARRMAPASKGWPMWRMHYNWYISWLPRKPSARAVSWGRHVPLQAGLSAVRCPGSFHSQVAMTCGMWHVGDRFSSLLAVANGVACAHTVGCWVAGIQGHEITNRRIGGGIYKLSECRDYLSTSLS
jgi:hypothetical protein